MLSVNPLQYLLIEVTLSSPSDNFDCYHRWSSAVWKRKDNSDDYLNTVNLYFTVSDCNVPFFSHCYATRFETIVSEFLLEGTIGIKYLKKEQLWFERFNFNLTFFLSVNWIQTVNKEASGLYAELLLCVCWHTEHIWIGPSDIKLLNILILSSRSDLSNLWLHIFCSRYGFFWFVLSLISTVCELFFTKEVLCFTLQDIFISWEVLVLAFLSDPSNLWLHIFCSRYGFFFICFVFDFNCLWTILY